MRKILALAVLALGLFSCATVPTSGSPSKTAQTAGILVGPVGYAAVASAQGYNHPAKVSGTCQIRDEAGNLSPCFNITLVLLDQDEHELSRARVKDGNHFEFLGKQDQKYWIRVSSELLRVAPEYSHKLSSGDSIQLVLEHTKR